MIVQVREDFHAEVLVVQGGRGDRGDHWGHEDKFWTVFSDRGRGCSQVHLFVFVLRLVGDIETV